MDNFFEHLGDVAVFSALDLDYGHWQISLADRDTDRTKFNTHLGTHRYTGMSFRLKNAPAILQRGLHIILFGVW